MATRFWEAGTCYPFKKSARLSKKLTYQVILDFLRDNEIEILKNFAVLHRTRKLQAFEKLCPNYSKKLHCWGLVAFIWEFNKKYYTILITFYLIHTFQ